jgi:hypothetical protein
VSPRVLQAQSGIEKKPIDELFQHCTHFPLLLVQFLCGGAFSPEEEEEKGKFLFQNQNLKNSRGIDPLKSLNGSVWFAGAGIKK